jgi:hypothetical chaperone protein
LPAPATFANRRRMTLSKTVCGIDFGTSNSAIAITRDGITELVPVEGTQTTIPSAIFFPVNGDKPLYGRAAIEAYAVHEPGRLLRSLKSILGSELIEEKTGVGGKYQSFEDILVGYVKHLKSKAEAYTGNKLTQVVMGRPVHFVDDNDAVDARAQAKLGDIARRAGFKSVAFQFEPIAAALSFEHTLSVDELVFIADIGGGTADFSVVRVGPQRRGKAKRSDDILANDGIRVGGTNLDMRLSMAAVMPHLGSHAQSIKGLDLPRWPFVDLATWHRIHTIDTPKNLHLLRQIYSDCAEPEVFARYLAIIRQQTGHLLAASVEKTKIQLSGQNSKQDSGQAQVSINLADIIPGVTVHATNAQFHTAIAHELERLTDAVKTTLTNAGLQGSAITTLFLTGGTCAVPAVKSLMLALLPTAKPIEGDLFNSVGFGLALDARRKFAAAKA